MAVLRVELDIDSEVNPELYARLASMERLAAREEKLRQLAATGLIWEIVRLHGPAFVDPAALPEAPAATPAPAIVEARSEVPEPLPAPEVAPAPEPEQAPIPLAVQETESPHEPEPTEIYAVDAGAVDDHVPHVPADVPVLHDVVDETEMADASPVDAAAAEAALARVMSLSKPVLQAVEALPAPAPGPDHEREPEPVPEPTGGKSRSARMKRMKDSGLFQNG